MNIPLKRLLVGGVMIAIATLPHALPTPSEPAPAEPAPANNDSRQIRVQVEFIELAHEQFTALMSAEHPAANDGTLRKQVGELVANSKATIVESMLCTAKHGQTSKSESIEEFIYPTEFEPSQIPAHPNNGTGIMTIEPHDPAVGPTASAWETRNLGSTLEIQPSLSDDNKLVNLRLVPELVYHVGNQLWSEWKDAHGTANVQTPTFYTLRLNTRVVTGVDEYLLAAALSPKNKDGFPDFSRKVMVFVKCDVLSSAR